MANRRSLLGHRSLDLAQGPLTEELLLRLHRR